MLTCEIPTSGCLCRRFAASIARCAAQLDASVTRSVFPLMEIRYSSLLSLCGALQVIGPPLHHFPEFRQILGVVLGLKQATFMRTSP